MKYKRNPVVIYFVFFLYLLFLTSGTFIDYLVHGMTLFAPVNIIHQLCLLAILYILSRTSLRVFTIFSTPLLFLVLANWSHYTVYDYPITIGGMSALIFTNISESLSFLSILPLKIFIIAIVIISLYLFLVFSKIKKSSLKVVLPFLIVPMITIILKFYKYGQEGMLRETFYKTRPAQTMITFVKSIEIIKKFNRLKSNQNTTPIGIIKKNQLIDDIHIVIIGESSRKHNWQLYGYPRNTNQDLNNDKEIFKLDDIISPSNVTLLSLQSSFYFSKSSHLKSDKTNHLINVLKESDYRTYWLSNQQMFSDIDSEVTILAKSADYSKFLNTDLYSLSYDEVLLPWLENILQDSYKKKVIFLHTMGSHGDYERRYPKKFEIERPSKDKKEHYINTYNNSIRYTSFLIRKIINKLKKMDVPSTLTYFSDHGETIYEDGVLFPTHGAPDFKKREVEIPYLIWFSKKYNKELPHIRNNLFEHKGKKTELRFFKNYFLSMLSFELEEKYQINGPFSKDFSGNETRYIMGTDYKVKTYEGLE